MTKRLYRILLVEDDHAIAMVISIGMQAIGIDYHLDHANGAEEGLELWERQPYDIVLTDYNLRGMNGLKMIEHLRKSGADVPTMLFTAYDSPQTARAARDQHITRYLVKPFLIDEFVRNTRELLGLNEPEAGETPLHETSTAS